MISNYFIRELAQIDLEEIWLHTYEEWGQEQADTYLNSLFSKFDWLGDNPLVGKKRDDIKKGYYCFPEGMHLIFYTVLQSRIEIIGIPHQNMDVVSHINQ